MKKILGRLFKWKPKSEHSAASPPAHEIALKHAAVRRRIQSAAEEAAAIGATGPSGIPEQALIARKKGAGRMRRLRSAAEKAGAAAEIEASATLKEAVAPGKERAKKRRPTDRSVFAADDFLRGGGKKIVPSADKAGGSVERSGASAVAAGKTKKTRRRRHSSFL